jgi:hypothetical protein
MAASDFSGGQGIVVPLVFPTLFGLNVLVGSGVSQFDPAPNMGPSVLRIDFSIAYLFDAGGFGPAWFEFANFPIASFAGPGDAATFSTTVNFFSTTLGRPIGPGINLSFVNAGLGELDATVGQFLPADTAIPAFDVVRMAGSVVFTADNQTGEASIVLTANGGFRPTTAIPAPPTTALLLIAFAAYYASNAAVRRRPLMIRHRC